MCSLVGADNGLYDETTTPSDFWTPSGSVTTTSAHAIRDRNLVTIYLRLGDVTFPSGQQNTVLGTIKPGWTPADYFMPWQGWPASGGFASGLVSSSSGQLSVRYSTEAMSPAPLILTATYPGGQQAG